MKTIDQNTLLTKYWEGKTTQEEEIQLFQGIESGTIEVTEAEKQYFQLLYSNQQIEAPSDLKSHVLNNTKKVVRFPTFHFNSWKIAASIAIILVSAWFIDQKMNSSEKELVAITDTFDNPEQAFEETKKALLLLSNSLGKGKKEAEKLSAFHKIQEKIGKKNSSNNTTEQ